MLIGLNLKAQRILLDASSSQIENSVRSQGVLLTKNFIEADIKTKSHYRKMIFRPAVIPPEGNSSLISITFYLTLKNKCFKYDEDYWGDELAYKRINELKTLYKLKEGKNTLQWISGDSKIEIDLIPEKIGNNKFASTYLLEFKEIVNYPTGS
jgi:hypothetical protein